MGNVSHFDREPMLPGFDTTTLRRTEDQLIAVFDWAFTHGLEEECYPIAMAFLDEKDVDLQLALQHAWAKADELCAQIAA